MEITEYLNLIDHELLPFIQLESDSPFDPIIVKNGSNTWNTVGVGNYAAVFVHLSKPDWVVKVYGRNPDERKKRLMFINN